MTDDIETIETLEIPDLLEQRDALAAELDEYDTEIRRRLLAAQRVRLSVPEHLRARGPYRPEPGEPWIGDSLRAAADEPTGSEIRRRLGIDE